MPQQKQPKHEQDIDAGIEQRSPESCEPHREHDTADHGGVYAREETRSPVHPKPWPREEIERRMPPPSDPDDPAGNA